MLEHLKVAAAWVGLVITTSGVMVATAVAFAPIAPPVPRSYGFIGVLVMSAASYILARFIELRSPYSIGPLLRAVIAGLSVVTAGTLAAAIYFLVVVIPVPAEGGDSWSWLVKVAVADAALCLLSLAFGLAALRAIRWGSVGFVLSYVAVALLNLLTRPAAMGPTPAAAVVFWVGSSLLLVATVAAKWTSLAAARRSPEQAPQPDAPEVGVDSEL